MTKILFLCLWYCSIYPGGFFMCAFALGVNYYTDRFSLMRTWKRPPALGTRISRFSRRYFFSLACVAMAVMSSAYWSGFPFDNLCDTDQMVEDNLFGEYTFVDPKNDNHNVTITLSETTSAHRFCLQNLLRPGEGNTFPFIPKQQEALGPDEWMTEDQELVTTVYGWSTVGVIVLIVVSFVSGWWLMVRSLFKGNYQAVGDDQGIAFSDVAAICAYIPQVESPLFAYPLLACKSEGLDTNLYDWENPDRPYSFYDLTLDADLLLRGLPLQAENGFTRIQHWPPPEKNNANNKAD